MDYEKRHVAFKPTLGGHSISADKTINELGKDAIHYIGTYSEYNPIGLVDNMLVFVKKYQSIHPKTDFKLHGFKLSGGEHTCGGNVTINNSVSFSKQDLLRIANAMDVDDKLMVAPTFGSWNGIKNETKIINDIKTITK